MKKKDKLCLRKKFFDQIDVFRISVSDIIKFLRMFLIELFRNSSMYGILAILILYGTLQSIHTNPIESSSNETVKSENNPIEGRFGNQINEVEWLLNQLISMMADMVNGIERDHTLLQNNHFRHILSQIIKRIDFILEHFENLESHHLSSSILNELDRIDCIRIRLANYLSQSRRFDDRKCHQQWTNIMSPSASDSSHQLGKVLNQIIELLTKIADQLNSIEHELKQIHHQQKHQHQHQQSISSQQSNHQRKSQ